MVNGLRAGIVKNEINVLWINSKIRQKENAHIGMITHLGNRIVQIY